MVSKGFVILLGCFIVLGLVSVAEGESLAAPLLAPVGTGFTYQGYLEDGGAPANADYDFEFKLFDASVAGSQVGSTVPSDNVPVNDGQFTVNLDFGDVFNGTALWLEIGVRPWDSVGLYTTLTPRQMLSAVPYASYVSHAPWDGLSGVPAGFLDGIDNNTTYSAGNGLILVGTQFRVTFSGSGAASTVARSDHDHFADAFIGSTSGNALYVENTGSGDGIWGQSQSSGGIGVAGFASDSGFARGVYGFSGSTNGYGVFGFTVAGDGVGGESQAENGRGVTGVGYWDGEGTAPTNYGVYGRSNSPSGYGGFFVNWDSSGVGYLLAANDAETISDLEFKVSNDGDVYADGQIAGASFAIGSADFAEMISPGDQTLEAGDVLVIGQEGTFLRSTAAFQTSVAGVYSTEPGYLAGVDIDDDGNLLETDKIPLAVVGIVPVKVSAENGAILPGDQLVASDTPGHAMRAGEDPRVGTVIGKALEALEEGTGMIQMLIMLQ